ncbi:MAG: hypothetical protein GC192_08010 [Bacteroidetes bacterium]|nr:hypothetical protein [Bacteroidota bacterium]
MSKLVAVVVIAEGNLRITPVNTHDSEVACGNDKKRREQSGAYKKRRGDSITSPTFRPPSIIKILWLAQQFAGF